MINFKELSFAIDLMAFYNQYKEKHTIDCLKHKRFKNRFHTKKAYWLNNYDQFDSEISKVDVINQLQSLKKDYRHPEIIRCENEIKKLEDKISVFIDFSLDYDLFLKKFINLFETIEKWTPRRGKHIKVVRGSRSASKDDYGIVNYERLRYIHVPVNGRILSQKIGFLNQDNIYCYTTGNSCVVINPDTVTHPETFTIMEVDRQKVSKLSKAYKLNFKISREFDKEYFVPISQSRLLMNNKYCYTPDWFLRKKGIFNG